MTSISTKTRKVSISPKFISFRHVLFDSCILRLWRAYMFFFDEKSNFRDIINNLEESSRNNYIRLNVLLFANKSSINNTSQITKLRKSVNKNSKLSKRCHKTIYALLVTIFYFELRSILKKISKDRLQYLETIRCRLFKNTIVKLLHKIYFSLLTFITNVKTLDYLEDKRNLCLLYWQFRKYVKFIVRNLN